MCSIGTGRRLPNQTCSWAATIRPLQALRLSSQTPVVWAVNQSFRYPEVLWGVNLVEILIQEWMFWSSITEVNESKWGNPKPTAQRPKGWPRRRQERQGNKKIILTPGWRTLMTSAVMSMFKSRNIQDSGSDAPIAPPTHSNSKKLGPGILEPHVICSAQLLHPVPNTLLVQRHQS